ncbi:DUF6431 domain-containing protein [Thermodesulfobacteriota bacterium]
MSHPIQSLIQSHTDKIVSGNIVAPERPCPRCSKKPETYKLHECRKRFFRFVVKNFIHIALTLLARWKCPICRETFTQYPEFALPHKRYVKSDIRGFSKNYIEDEKQTYASVVTHNNGTIGYQHDDNRPVDRLLNPSTPWRWINWLGRIANEPLKEMPDLQPPEVYPEKYSSLHRKRILQAARALLNLSDYLREMIFPRFAIKEASN